MTKDLYHIEIEYHGHLQQFGIKTYPDQQTNSIQHDIWIDGDYLNILT